MDVPIGDEKETIEKDQSTLEMVAYRDTWGRGTDSYLHMMFERLSLMKELLGEQGSNEHEPHAGLPGWKGTAHADRSADDFVVLARYQSQRLVAFIETTLEQRFGLEINRDKTRVVDLKEPKAGLGKQSGACRCHPAQRPKTCAQTPKSQSPGFTLTFWGLSL